MTLVRVLENINMHPKSNVPHNGLWEGFEWKQEEAVSLMHW